MCRVNKMGDNQFCFACGKPAYVFGIQGKKKLSACDHCVSELRKKHFTIYDIEGFYFINSLKDGSEFESRRWKREVALEKLEVLQSNCDAELNRAVEQASRAPNPELVCRNLEQTHREITGLLDTLRGNLKTWVGLRTAQLTRGELCLISDLKLDHNKVKEAMIGLVSSRDSQLQVELERCIVKCSFKTSRIDAQLAKLNLENELTVLLQIGPQCDEGEAKRVIAKYAARAHQEFTARRIDSCVQNWQSALSLLSLRFPQSKDIANAHFELGFIYLWYLTRYEEAEVTFQNCLIIEKAINPHSDDLCKVLNYLGYIKFRLSKEREAEETLTGSLGKATNSEILAMGLCFLGQIYERTGRVEESERTLKRAYGVSSDVPHALAAQYLGDLWSGKRHREAEEKYQEALSFFRVHSDIHLANCLSNFGLLLGDTNRVSEAEQAYREAMEIYRSFPESIGMATCLSNLGTLLSETNRISESEQAHREAMEIYRSFPESIGMANSLSNFGLLLSDTNRVSEAEQAYREAMEIYLSLPKSVQMANCLYNLGNLLSSTNRVSEAEQAYREAMEIYRSFSRVMDVADCLSNLGNLLRNTNRASDAGQAFREAMEIYRSFPESIGMANCLSNLGLHLSNANRVSEAEQAYREAMKIHRSFPKSIHMAKCLSNFGALLCETNRVSESEQAYREAMEIYCSFPKSIQMANCLYNLGKLLRNSNRESDAEQAYREAMEIFRSFSRATDVADCLLVLGDILSNSKRNEATLLYTAAREVYQASENAAQISVCNRKLQALKKH